MELWDILQELVSPIAARTGAMATALMVRGEEKRFAESLGDSLVRLNSYATCTCHVIDRFNFGFSGLKIAPQEYAGGTRWLLILSFVACLMEEPFGGRETWR